jgi:hypothetical protein
MCQASLWKLNTSETRALAYDKDTEPFTLRVGNDAKITSGDNTTTMLGMPCFQTDLEEPSICARPARLGGK